MLKFTGVLFIIISSSLIGFLKSRSLTLRHKKLLRLSGGLNLFYEYVEQGSFEIYTAVANAFNDCKFLEIKREKIICTDTDLTAEQQSEINDFFKLMGTGFKKEECDRIKNFEIYVKGQLKNAENDVNQKCRLYQTFGVCLGLMLGILLI